MLIRVPHTGWVRESLMLASHYPRFRGPDMCDLLYRTSVELSLDATLYPFLLRADHDCVNPVPLTFDGRAIARPMLDA
jgi:hypothetical protein